MWKYYRESCKSNDVFSSERGKKETVNNLLSLVTDHQGKNDSNLMHLKRKCAASLRLIEERVHEVTANCVIPYWFLHESHTCVRACVYAYFFIYMTNMHNAYQKQAPCYKTSSNKKVIIFKRIEKSISTIKMSFCAKHKHNKTVALHWVILQIFSRRFYTILWLPNFICNYCSSGAKNVFIPCLHC